MSIPGGESDTVVMSRPGDPVRLTSKNIDLERHQDPAAAWPPGHPRGGADPIPAALWIGPRQPLQARTVADTLACPAKGEEGRGIRLEAVAALAMLREPPGTRYVPLPREGGPATRSTPTQARENARLLNLIDLEMHAGRQLVVAIDSLAENPFADEQRIRITARRYWPDGTVYYVGDDDGPADKSLRLYVHEDDLSLISLD